MPEDPEVAAFVKKIEDHCARIAQKQKDAGSVSGKFKFHVRTWAMGTSEKPFNTCSLRAVDGSKLPSVDINKVDPHDLARCTRGGDHPSWLPLLADHAPGQLLVKQRGKDMLIAAGPILVTINFSLEGCLSQCTSEEFARLTATCVPGAAKNRRKAMMMRAFLGPRDLFVPGSRAYRSQDVRRLNILLSVESAGTVFFVVDHNRLVQFRCLYRERHWTADDLTLSPNELWPDNLGPDWVTEVEAAYEQADIWRRTVLSQGSLRPIAAVLISDRATFNGFGRHTANDVCHQLQLHPVTPACEVCDDDARWLEFKHCLHEYLSSLRAPKVLKNAGGTINSLYPFQFHASGSTYFINMCVTVFRKSEVQIPSDQWVQMAEKGLFDSGHTIGEPYAVRAPRPRHHSKKADVFTYCVGQDTYFTAIQAIPPAHWASGTLHAHGDGWRDMRMEGDTPTVGPQQFHIYNINRIHQEHWAEYAQVLKASAVAQGVEADDIEALPLVDDDGVNMDHELPPTALPQVKAVGRPRKMPSGPGGGRPRLFKPSRELRLYRVPLAVVNSLQTKVDQAEVSDDKGEEPPAIASRTRARKRQAQEENVEPVPLPAKRQRRL